MSEPKDSIWTRVVDTTKHFIISIETPFKRFDFSVHKAATRSSAIADKPHDGGL